MVDQVREHESAPVQISRRHFYMPSWELLVLAAALIVAAGYLGVVAYMRDPRVRVVYERPYAAPTISGASASEPQTAPAVPVIKEWPKVEVQWREILPTPGTSLFAPIQGDGFYTGTQTVPIPGDPNGGRTSRATPEGFAFIATILPQLKEDSLVAAARDSVDKNIVFVSITGYDNQRDLRPYLLISLDGEKSWHELNLPPILGPAVGSGGVRVKAEGDSIHLIAADNTVAEKWWATTIKKNGL